RDSRGDEHDVTRGGVQPSHGGARRRAGGERLPLRARPRMKMLLRAIGVDYEQWKALTIVALKLDFRQGGFGRARMAREARSVAAIVFQAVFYMIYGLFMSILVLVAQDLLLVGTVLM